MNHADMPATASTWKCPKCGVVNPTTKDQCVGGFCDQSKPPAQEGNANVDL
jgi:phage FluMu protein Com